MSEITDGERRTHPRPGDPSMRVAIALAIPGRRRVAAAR